MSRRRKKDSSPWNADAGSPEPLSRFASCAAAGSRKRGHTALPSPKLKRRYSRLRDRQVEIRAADEALDELEAASRPETIAQKLASKGFGPRGRATADDVLSRLRARAEGVAATSAAPQA